MKVFDALKELLGLRAGSSQWRQAPARRQSNAPQSQRRAGFDTQLFSVIAFALETGSNNIKVEGKREAGKQISRKAVR